MNIRNSKSLVLDRLQFTGIDSNNPAAISKILIAQDSDGNLEYGTIASGITGDIVVDSVISNSLILEQALPSAGFGAIELLRLAWNDSLSQNQETGDGTKISFHTSAVNNDLGTTEGASIAALKANGSESDTANNLIFSVNDASTVSEAMRIRCDGNVGIGAINPSEQLQVNGNIKTTGDIIRDGDLTIVSTQYFAIRKIERRLIDNFGTSTIENFTTENNQTYKFIISGSFNSTGGVATALLEFVNISTGPGDPVDVVYDTITIQAGSHTSGDDGTFQTIELEGEETEAQSTGGGRIRITLSNCDTNADTDWIITQYQIK